MLIILGIIVGALVGIFLYIHQCSYQNLPPGPFRIPILGSIPAIWCMKPTLHMMTVKPWEYVHFLQKRYGDIFTIQLGPFCGVTICSYEIMNELANTDEYSMKLTHDMTRDRTFGKELGLIFVANHDIWHEMRKFSQRTLRDFGFGKRHTMQSLIEQEIAETVKEFETAAKENDGILKINTTFMLSVLNVLWCMIAGVQYDHDDPNLVKMMESNLMAMKSRTFLEPIVGLFPWARKVFPILFGENLRNKMYNDCHEFSKNLIDERRSEGFYLTEPQNYIDCFLKKMDETKGNPKSVYTEEQLQAMIEDFLQTGTTTTNGTLNYGVLFLTLNPEVQKRCQMEIDAIVPRYLVPRVEDIEKMPFLQATILEIHRLGNIVPNPIPRTVPFDFNYRGYHIPKDALIVTNHYSVMMDKNHWGDPENFRPERFINANGEFVPDKHVVHFGFGKRYCIGVTLANSIIPVYLATLLQNFDFSVVPGTKPPSTEPEIGLSLSPYEFSTFVNVRV